MGQEKKYDVFISYSRKDSTIADEICEAFGRAGITYFIDRKGIGGGNEFPLELATSILNSQVFLLLGSKNSYESKYTNAEIHFAFKKKQQKSILPYILDDTPMPLEIDFILSTINWRKYQEHPINTILVDDVLKLLGREQTKEVNTLVDIEQAKRDALPDGEFQVGDLMYKASEKGCSVTVIGLADKDAREIEIPAQIQYGKYTFTVDTIGTGAFYRCTKLASITIPNSVTSIGESAFARCSRMTSVTIPNSVTSIGEYAFCRCTKLASITIPNSVTSIGEMAFAWCSGLTSVTIPNSMTSIGNEFSHCHGLTDIIIPNSVTSISEFAFCYCHGLVSVTIPNSVTKIGHAAFMECSGLTSITLPNNVISIEEHTFAHCVGLSSITIPNSVTSIGDWAFQNCKALSTITFPNSVTSIGEGAFSWCSALKSVWIPMSLTHIGRDAFPAHTKVIRD